MKNPEVRRPPAGLARLARLAFVSAVILAPALGLSALGVSREPQRSLPVLGRVADFALVDQSRSPVTRAAFDGEPWIANFAFTRCASVCPRLMQRMRAIQRLAQKNATALRLVTFSVDPVHDDPEVLKGYAEAHGADFSNWEFLTGSEASIERIARSFAVAADGETDPTKPDFGILHSGHLILVDGSGRIRGYYPSSEEGVAEKIIADLDRIRAS